MKNEIVLRRKKKEPGYQINQNTQGMPSMSNIANIIKMTQWNFYKVIIHENHNDYKAIFNITNSLLFRKTDSPMPNIKPLSALVEGFSEFFYTRIAKSWINSSSVCLHRTPANTLKRNTRQTSKCVSSCQCSIQIS